LDGRGPELLGDVTSPIPFSWRNASSPAVNAALRMPMLSTIKAIATRSSISVNAGRVWCERRLMAAPCVKAVSRDAEGTIRTPPRRGRTPDHFSGGLTTGFSAGGGTGGTAWITPPGPT
jgi:hypothetical protein